MNKAFICAICGMWARIHRLECLVDFLFKGASFDFGETSKDTTSYIVAGRGVSFANVSESGLASDLQIIYIGGGVCRIYGSCLAYTNNFTERIACYNYDDDGVEPTKSTSRKGNPDLRDENTKPGGFGSQLFYEIRILKEEFPQIMRFFTGYGLNMEGGGYHVEFVYSDEGVYAAGQYGRCDRETGDPARPGNSRGHLVPEGWMYIQCRITWIEKMNASGDGTQYTPTGLIGIRMNQDEVDCD